MAELTPGRIRLETLKRWLDSAPLELSLAADFWPGVEAARATVLEVARGDVPVYGVNTGFGRLAAVRIPAAEIEELQRRIVASHMTGVGEPLDARTVRLILILKAASLGRGHSGVKPETIRALLACLARDLLPEIPAQGSVGASGDLAPLAHLSGALIGQGRARLKGQVLPARTALERAGIAPLDLGAKEGLALLNGTQVSTSIAITALEKIERLHEVGLIAGAMTTDAALGSDVPFDPRIHEVRNQPGQAEAAARLKELIEGSAIRASHLECDRVQDPYSLRCQPQVMGAALDVLLEAMACLEREANGVSDNPLVFPEDGSILSGGNFHAEPVALAADRLALAAAEIGSLAERRIALLIDTGFSSLPPFLTPDPGLNSGFMLTQVTAAALAAENKHLATPVATESLPTSANQEDHVSMAPYAALRLHRMADNLARILAIELLCAAQGIDLRRPLESSRRLEAVHARIRQLSARLDDDRPLADDIEALSRLILEGGIRA